ncbi:MAG: hypothetical protein Q9163_006221 [Psora crenata]
MSPLELSNFESEARRLRYQALGGLCKKQGLSVFMTAHHKDDQAETTLMRLSSGSTGTGIQVIKSRASIPECWGMHGVHESGGFELAKGRLLRAKCLEQNDEPHCHQDHEGLKRILASKPAIEYGGITVIRPLLAFEKKHLVRTCEANNIAWEEDETNQQCGQTPRNAIRYLLNTRALPEALGKSSLLRMTDRIVARNHEIEAQVRKQLRRCHILSFDIRSGRLQVRLPKLIATSDSGVSLDPTVFRQQVAARLLSYLISCVTPFESVRLRSLQNAAETIFADCSPSQSDSVQDGSTFTAGGAWFRRTRSLSTQEELSQHPDLDRSYIWDLCRHPHQSLPIALYFPAPGQRLSGPGIPNSTSGLPISREGTAGTWTAWQLWDGRYWIRVKNLSKNTLVVRPLSKSDIQTTRDSTCQEAWRALYETLKQTAPGKIRWTLPVIAETYACGTRPDKVLVLPTLGRVGYLDVIDKDGAAKLEWEIRYKSVPLRDLSQNNDPLTDPSTRDVYPGLPKRVLSSWDS